MPLRIQSLLRVAAIGATVLALTAASAGCGDSDDDTGSAGGEGAATAPATESRGETGGGAPPSESGGGSGPAASDGPTLSGNPGAARQGAAAVDTVYDDLGDAVRDGIAATNVGVRDTLAAAEDNGGLGTVCQLLSDDARRQTVTYAKRSAGLAGIDWTCEKAIGLLLRRTRQTGGLKQTLSAELIGVNAQGDRATATIRFGGPKGRTTTVALVKEDGAWKLAAAPSGGGN